MRVGDLPAGPRNSITDVPDVRVGHRTLVRDLPDGRSVRTGVTAIVPHSGDLVADKTVATSFVLNGYGKTTGLVQLDELGTLESPIMLTNTLSVPAVAEGTILWLLRPRPDLRSVNVVVGECNDGYLNDIRGMHVRAADAMAAIENAGDEVQEGSIGAGTGMSCFGFKGGIGTSSRRTEEGILGVLVLANFGRERDLAPHGWLVSTDAPSGSMGGPDAGSIIVVVGTDASVDARQLRRVAIRAALGIARAGGYAAHSSGDIVIAFGRRGSLMETPLRDDSSAMDQLFRAAVEATHEAIVNAICVADTMSGDAGHTRDAFPVSRLQRA